jgi:hypothetical protein
MPNRFQAAIRANRIQALASDEVSKMIAPRQVDAQPAGRF